MNALKIRLFLLSVFVTALCLSATVPAQAQYTVTQDLTALQGTDPFYFEFQLSDGSQSGDGTSMVRISHVELTGVTLTGDASSLGSVSGNLSTTLILRDTNSNFNGLADFIQGFVATPGEVSRIRFNLDLSSTAGGDALLPDGFFYTLLNFSEFPLPTTGPVGIEYLSADLFGKQPPVLNAYDTGNTSDYPDLAKPSFFLREQIAAPEPGTLCLTLTVFMSLPGWFYHRKKIKRFKVQ